MQFLTYETVKFSVAEALIALSLIYWVILFIAIDLTIATAAAAPFIKEAMFS